MESLDLSHARRLSPLERRRTRERALVPRSVIARDLGCAESTIVRWERGDRQPTGTLGARYGALLLSLALQRGGFTQRPDV